MNRRPHIGVGVMVWHGDKLLLGKRISRHADSSWQFPGGHLEFGETVEACARREVAEETGIAISAVTPCGFANDVFIDRDRHYVTLFVTAEYSSGEAKVMEQDKCEQWGWFRWNRLPEPLFAPIRNFLKQYPDLRAVHSVRGIRSGARK